MKKIISLMMSLMFLLNLIPIEVLAQEDNPVELPVAFRLSGVKGSIVSVDYSSDDKFIVAGDEKGWISVFNASNGALIKQWQATNSMYGFVLDVQYISNNKTIASIDNDYNIKFWDTANGALISTLSNGNHEDDLILFNSYGDIEFNEDETILYSNDGDSIVFWDTASGDKIHEITEYNAKMAYNSKENHLAVAVSNRINIYDAVTGAYIKTVLDIGLDYVKGLEYDAGGNYLFLTGSANYYEEKQPRLFDVKNNYEKISLSKDEFYGSGGNGGVHWSKIAFSKDGKYVVTSDTYSGLDVFEIKTKKTIGSVEYPYTYSAYSNVYELGDNLTFSNDSKRLVLGTTVFDTSVLPNRELTGIKIEIKSPTMELNKNQVILVKGIFSDGTEKEIDTSLVTWSSDNPSIANLLYGNLYSYSAGKTTITASYKTFQSSVDIQVNKALEKIEISKLPSKKDYMEGQNLDITGIEVIGTYNDGSQEVIEIGPNNITGFDSSKPATGQDVTVTVAGKTAKFKVNVVANSLQSIAVTPPTKTDYIVGQSLDLKGLVATGTYLDGTEKELPVSMNNISGFNSSKPATSQEVTVTVSGKTGKFKVNVIANSLQSIAVTPPTKTDYIVGQSLDLKGLVITGTYLDGTKKELPVSMNNISGFNSSKPATGQEVTVTVNGKTAKFKVNVTANSLQSIAVTPPTKTDYKVGESLDMTGIVVTKKFMDGSTSKANISMANISGFNSSYAAIGQKVTVSVDGKTAAFTVNIAELPKASFNDTVNHWASGYIADLSSRKIINGYNDNTFRPENLISREEAAQMLSNYIGGSGGSAEVPYDSEGRWSTPAIQNLISKRVINGYDDGSFRPENQITRAEFSTMVYNMMSSRGKLGSAGRSFGDTAGHWGQNAIGSLAGNGIINGYDDGSFRPDSNITRAEAATIISKSISK